MRYYMAWQCSVNELDKGQYLLATVTIINRESGTNLLKLSVSYINTYTKQCSQAAGTLYLYSH